ncbi:hypothetical protein [Nitratiruptor tergarcus]|uniref:Uncharacterized protein n=1 Tax=Nitratiruptor tergarcus DSM 16512 TaxID=1069081 RepID=A0A1W1WSU8_9BACT|nr:hypothetical protein [Nitratiruptor tergarcus]SMC09367.1 hypothetical protein SAMN05660197_1174 [Nitratiruptor tergarcus DSM 16512]
MRKLILFALSLLLFVGCSSKRYFEPKEIAGYVDFDGKLPAPIVDVLRDGATLEDGEFISKDGLENYRLPKGYLFINKSNGYYIAANKCGDLLIIDSKSHKKVLQKHFTMRSPIAANITKDKRVALVFDDNSLMLYDIVGKHVIYATEQGKSIAVDTKIANPFFLGQLTVFPTLDGKLVVVDPTGKELRTLIVGTKKHFNNVIFLDVIDEKLIAATPNKIISVSPTFSNTLDLSLSDVLYAKGRVYLLTKDGEIILTDPQLNIMKRRKYPFAHFTGAVYGEYIYVVEKEGYIIAVDKDLRVSNIFGFPSGIEEYIFTSKDKIFYDNNYFELKKL